MQTKNINHQHDPQGLVHQNCHLTNGTNSDIHSLGAIPNDRLYGSTSALYQRPDLTTVNLNGSVRNKSTTSSIPKMLSPLRCGPTNSYRSSIHSHNHQLTNAGQVNSCASTPVMSGSTHILRRQTSLGQLEDHSMVSQTQNSDRRFGSFQQKIRSMLTPAKDSCKTGPNEASTSSQSSNYNDSQQCSEIRQMAETSSQNTLQNTSQNTHNQYSAVETTIKNQPLGAFNTMEDENDSFHLRDVCSKWFAQKQSQSFSSNMASAVNKSSLVNDSPKMSHNMKTTLYDKVVAKDNICQNSYPNDDNQVLQASPLRQVNICPPNYVDIRRPTSENCVLTPNDQHVVVVSGLESNTTRDNALTVRSEMSSNELIIESKAIPSSNYQRNGLSASAIPNMGELPECVDSNGYQDNNYKSSSESGRGTMRSNLDSVVKHDSPDGVSPSDLTSLDSDQSTPGLTTSVWVKQNMNSDSCLETVSSNETIEKMQRELQRILEDGSVQSSEVEVDELSKSFQTRLSVVNESDSWTSNSAPQTPQTGTQSKFSESKIESKCSKISSNGMNSNGLKNTSCKTISSSKSKQKSTTSEKQVILSINKQNASHEKNKYPIQRSSKYSTNTGSKRTINDRSYYNLPNKAKLRQPQQLFKNKDRFINIVDCDLVSTTTARDSNYADDLSSEYTANTSFCDRDEVFSIRKQLQGLENMYSEIVGLLGPRMKTNSGHKMRRKACSRTSSVTGRSSVTSRGTRDYFYKRNKHEYRKYRTDESSHSSRRIKRLESHVITLARSVAQLSTDMRYNHSLSQELENLRQDIDLIKDQLLALKHNLPNGLGMSSKPYHQSNGHISANGRRHVVHLINPNKVEKLTRFFGDEPPLLRQFLKKLGYEKYARNFESEKIGITELPYLSEERIQKLGIPMGPRLRIIQESQTTLKSISNDQFSIYGVV